MTHDGVNIAEQPCHLPADFGNFSLDFVTGRLRKDKDFGGGGGGPPHADGSLLFNFKRSTLKNPAADGGACFEIFKAPWRRAVSLSRLALSL